MFILGIEKASQVSRDPLLGHIFENLIVIECLKARTNAGKGLKRIAALSPRVAHKYQVYSGDSFEFSNGTTALKYDQLSEIFSE